MFEPIMSLETARAILASRMQGLTDALSQCQETWNNSNQGYAFAQMILDGSARAHVINQHWYANARTIFAGDSGVLFSREQFQRYLVFDEKVILRFKLLDNNLHASNYPTDHAIDWLQQIPLPDIPPCARVHYGYRMDVTGTRVKDAFIILPQSKLDNAWVWQTSGEPIDTFGFQLPLSEASAPSLVYWYDNYSLGGIA